MTAAAPLATEGAAARPSRVPLASIQVMRGIAALAVAIYHTHLILSQPRYGGIDLWGAVAGKGWTGVNFFFVLSGFIIPYAHHADIGRPERAGHYLMRRFTRVYPIYWVFLTGFLAAIAMGLGTLEFSWAWPNILGSYLLLQIVPVPTLPLHVAWTLFYEIFFYFMFLLLILDRRIGSVVIGLWGAAVIGWGLILGHDTNYWYLHSWNLYFALGALAYVGYRRWEGRPGLPFLIAGFLMLGGLLAAGLVGNHLGTVQEHPRTLLLLGPPFALILLGAVLIDRRRRWKPAAALALPGEASYAIYLVHSPVISALAQANRTLTRHGHIIGHHLLYVVVALVSVASGLIAHLLVERPLLRGIRSITDRRARARASARQPEWKASRS